MRTRHLNKARSWASRRAAQARAALDLAYRHRFPRSPTAGQSKVSRTHLRAARCGAARCTRGCGRAPRPWRPSPLLPRRRRLNRTRRQTAPRVRRTGPARSPAPPTERPRRRSARGAMVRGTRAGGCVVVRCLSEGAAGMAVPCESTTLVPFAAAPRGAGPRRGGPSLLLPASPCHLRTRDPELLRPMRPALGKLPSPG